jgi:hypothetical protein
MLNNSTTSVLRGVLKYVNLQMEYNKEITSAALGLVYICVFWQFCKVLKGLSNSRKKSN